MAASERKIWQLSEIVIKFLHSLNLPILNSTAKIQKFMMKNMRMFEPMLVRCEYQKILHYQDESERQIIAIQRLSEASEMLTDYEKDHEKIILAALDPQNRATYPQKHKKLDTSIMKIENTKNAMECLIFGYTGFSTDNHTN